MHYAVIMAGGPGTRLWPLSRGDRPKQLLRLFEQRSLLRLSYERLTPLFPADRILVITGDQHLDQVARELPELAESNLIGEPVGRDTANAVALSAAVLAARDPEGTMGVFTADHVITPVDQFCRAVETGFRAVEAHPQYLGTFGIRPTRPDTGFGYLERGDELAPGVYRVQRFAEKPTPALAAQYVSGGRHLWNSGMFVWKLPTILQLLDRHLPETMKSLREVTGHWGTSRGRQMLAEAYPKLKRISVDYAVMERAEHVLMVEMACDWADVGSWPAVAAVLNADNAGNAQAAERVIHMDSHSTLVVSDNDHLVATLGVDDLVIVHTRDATLVCSRSRAAALKDLVQLVKERFGECYL